MSEEIFNRYQVSVPIGSGKYVIMIMETILYKKHGTILYTGSIGGGRCVLLGGGGLNLGISLRGCKLCLTDEGRLRFQAA